MKTIRLVLLLSCLISIPRLHAGSDETPEQHAQRMAWWREARFGMFIHWGIYSVPAGIWQGQKIDHIGEWIMHDARIPVAEYASYAAGFNPVKFDAEAWVRTAKAAGMKYIIITAKHHDGFAMFDTAASTYDIVDATPFKRDPLKELAAACAREGIRLGFYYSQAQDWHHAGGAARGGHWDKAQEGSMDAYLKNVAYPQVKELLTKYGPVAVLWWDTPEGMTQERAATLAPLLSLQPGIISNNRLGGGFLGDTETPENRVPATGYPRDWEACMTMNDTWGFKSWDDNWKSSEALIRTLVDIASKGGNYLLNVGPTALGEIPAPSLERLRDVGTWMNKHSEAIYGTTASPFLRLGWGRTTRKGDTLYLHVFSWPADGKLVVPMRGVPSSARLLSGTGEKLTYATSASGLTVTVPRKAPDPVASVIVLEGMNNIDPLPPPPLAPDSAGHLELQGDEALLSGPGLRVTGNTRLQLSDWRDMRAAATWEVQVPVTAEYEVTALAQYHARSLGAVYVLAAGESSLEGTISGVAGDQFVARTLGHITLPGGRPVKLTLRTTNLPGGEFISLRTLQLRPVTAK